MPIILDPSDPLSARDEFRLLIGDTDSTSPLFNDTEADYLLNRRNGNVLAAAADACDALAVRFARDVDFTVDGTSVSRMRRSESYRALARAYRARAGAGGGLASIPITTGLFITATDELLP